MTITCSTTIKSDIVSTVTNDQGGNNKQRYTYNLNYSLIYSYGTGTLDQSGVDNSQVNLFGVNSGTLSGGQSQVIDFNALTATNLGSEYTLNFDRLLGVVIQNQATGTGLILNVRATGAEGFQALFNGTGNTPINPSCTYMYTDLYGTQVDASSGKLFLHNVAPTGSGNEVNYKMVSIGVDPTGLNTNLLPTP